MFLPRLEKWLQIHKTTEPSLMYSTATSAPAQRANNIVSIKDQITRDFVLREYFFCYTMELLFF